MKHVKTITAKVETMMATMDKYGLRKFVADLKKENVSGYVAKIPDIAGNATVDFLTKYANQFREDYVKPNLDKAMDMVTSLTLPILGAIDGVCGLFPFVGAGICSVVTTLVGIAQTWLQSWKIKIMDDVIHKQLLRLVEYASNQVNEFIGGAVKYVVPHIKAAEEKAFKLSSKLQEMWDKMKKKAGRHFDKLKKIFQGFVKRFMKDSLPMLDECKSMIGTTINMLEFVDAGMSPTTTTSTTTTITTTTDPTETLTPSSSNSSNSWAKTKPRWGWAKKKSRWGWAKRKPRWGW